MLSIFVYHYFRISFKNLWEKVEVFGIGFWWDVIWCCEIAEVILISVSKSGGRNRLTEWLHFSIFVSINSFVVGAYTIVSVYLFWWMIRIWCIACFWIWIRVFTVQLARNSANHLFLRSLTLKAWLLDGRGFQNQPVENKVNYGLLASVPSQEKHVI